MQPIYLNLELWKVLSAAIGGVLVWAANNWYQRRLDYIQRKQDLYSELLVKIASLYKDPESHGVQADREALLEQYRRSWLYASDDVVRSAGKLMDTLKKSQEEDRANSREVALSCLILAMRRDLMAKWWWLPGSPKSAIAAEDFRHVRV